MGVTMREGDREYFYHLWINTFRELLERVRSIMPLPVKLRRKSFIIRLTIQRYHKKQA